MLSPCAGLDISHHGDVAYESMRTSTVASEYSSKSEDKSGGSDKEVVALKGEMAALLSRCVPPADAQDTDVRAAVHMEHVAAACEH